MVSIICTGNLHAQNCGIFYFQVTRYFISNVIQCFSHTRYTMLYIILITFQDLSMVSFVGS